MRGRLFLRRYSQLFALSGCTASLCFVLFGRKYIDKSKIYRNASVSNGKLLFGDTYLRELLKEVGHKMGYSTDSLAGVVLYHTSLDSPIYHGCLTPPLANILPSSLSLAVNCGIGLPLYYKLKYLDESNYDQLVINGKIINIEADSPEGVQLRRQMLLTEDAKRFIIARQLFYLNSNIDSIRDCVSVGAVYLTYQLAFIMNRTIKVIPLLPTPSRILIYSFIGGLVYFIKREIMEAYLSRFHYKADRVAYLDARLHSGALEFYQKLIKRNKILHDLGFTKQFSKLGNEISGIIINYSAVNSHVRLSRLMNRHKDDD